MEKIQDYKKLDRYWDKKGKKERVSEQLALKASNILHSANNGKYKIISEIIRANSIFAYGILALICEMVENYFRKKQLCRLLNLQKDEVAIDINELAKYKEKIRCFGDSFTFNAHTRKDYLCNLEVIYGDAHLEALEDIDLLPKLVKVTGKIYYRRKVFMRLSDVKKE